MINIKKALTDFGTIGLTLFVILILVNLVFGDKPHFSPPTPQIENDMAHSRKDFKLTAQDYVNYLQRELYTFQATLAKEVQEKRMSRREAAKKFMVQDDMLNLMKIAAKQNLKYEDVLRFLEDRHIQPAEKQKKLFNRTQYPK